jgi:hypothetical protein
LDESGSKAADLMLASAKTANTCAMSDDNISWWDERWIEVLEEEEGNKYEPSAAGVQVFKENVGCVGGKYITARHGDKPQAHWSSGSSADLSPKRTLFKNCNGLLRISFVSVQIDQLYGRQRRES